MFLLTKLYVYATGTGFTKGLSLDLDVKLRHLSLIHVKSVILDLVDFTKQQPLSLAKSWASNFNFCKQRL